MLPFFRLAARGVLPVPSGPDRHVQLIYAPDLADALVRAATTRGASGIYHVAEPRAYRWSDIADLLARAVGRSHVRRVTVPRWLVRAAAATSELGARLAGRTTIFNHEKAAELLAPAWLCETEAARRAFGLEARMPLAEGLRQTAEWYRAAGWLRDGPVTPLP